MRSESSALAATLRALHGKTDVHVIALALDNQCFACMPALAPNVDPLVGALSALAGGLQELLAPAMRESPALSAAITFLIGTDAGDRILSTWAEVAPAGWGASYASTLIDAVCVRRFQPWGATALIGLCDASATLVIQTGDIARAVRRGGQTTPSTPTAWMDNLTPAECDLLLAPVHTGFFNNVRRLLWLPAEYAANVTGRIAPADVSEGLAAYAEASPIARIRHADILAALMQRARPNDLIELTRLAVASRMDAAWNTMVHLLCKDPEYADHVVTAAPWDDLHPGVQTTILSAADHNDVCAAIAFARGVRSDAPPITQKTARAFFAAVIPEVWNTLTKRTQRAWRSKRDAWHAHLAIQSPGPSSTFLAHACLDDALIAAVRRHATDEGSVCQILLPVAVRALSVAAIPAVVAALPPPPNPVAFVQIAGRTRDLPPALRGWIAAHPTPQARGAVSAMLHAGLRSITTPVAARCQAPASAFTGWSSEETTALLTALPKDVRTALHPDSSALAQRLAHADQRDAFIHALTTLAALPSSVALPSLYALDALAATRSFSAQRSAGAALAQARRNHGACFLGIMDTLADAPRKAILPRPQSGRRAVAVRAIAAADPLVAHLPAHALRSRFPTAALDALTHAPLSETEDIWRLLPETIQHAVLGDRDALASSAAAPGRVDDLAQTLQDWRADDPLPRLALRLLIDGAGERRARGAAIPAQRPDLATALLPLLRDDLHPPPKSVPAIGFAGADLPPPSASVRRRRHRRTAAIVLAEQSLSCVRSASPLHRRAYHESDDSLLRSICYASPIHPIDGDGASAPRCIRPTRYRARALQSPARLCARACAGRPSCHQRTRRTDKRAARTAFADDARLARPLRRCCVADRHGHGRRHLAEVGGGRTRRVGRIPCRADARK